jgi:hypothetical protein
MFIAFMRCAGISTHYFSDLSNIHYSMHFLLRHAREVKMHLHRRFKQSIPKELAQSITHSHQRAS